MRANGWDVALVEWAEQRHGQAFVWGQTDCTLLVAEAIDLITGVQTHARRLRGRWADLPSAVEWSRVNQLDLLQGCLAAGCVEVENARLLQRGDLVLAPFIRYDHVQVWCGHVVFGERALSSSPELGVHWLPTEQITARGHEWLLRVGA